MAARGGKHIRIGSAAERASRRCVTGCVFEKPFGWSIPSGEVDMTLPLDNNTHSPLTTIASVPRPHRPKWLRQNWPLATITAGVFIMLVWMTALMCFALMFARRI